MAELLKVLTVGGRKSLLVPEDPTSITQESDGISQKDHKIYLDFCPEIEKDYYIIELTHINCYPAPDKITTGNKVRVQFDNKQRKYLLKNWFTCKNGSDFMNKEI